LTAAAVVGYSYNTGSKSEPGVESFIFRGWSKLAFMKSGVVVRSLEANFISEGAIALLSFIE
jgi:hypothetical protein